MEKLFDTHAHYFDEKFSSLPGGAEALLTELFSSDIGCILNCATTTRDCKSVIELAERFDGCYAAVGVHPENCDEEENPEDALIELEKLIKHKKVVAIGEIGLDYYREDNPPRAKQKEFFISQLELARKTGLPVVIHDRDAHGDTFDILKHYKDVTAVLHSYSGSPEMARQYLSDMNRYISFSGVLTFKNAVATVETAKIVPLDRMLTETDCPYLAPVPYRGKINHSGYMIKTIERLAEIKGLTVEKTVAKLNENAKQLFCRQS